VTRTGGVARETVRSRARYAVDGNATLRLAVGPPCSKPTVEGIKGQCLTWIYYWLRIPRSHLAFLRQRLST